MLKRVFDILVAALALLIASPAIAFGMIGILLTSPGPVFYIAKRAGRGGETFSMYKLRTMHVNADKGAAITAPEDNRIFRFGAFLRTSKIDELPQFWNVLTGDMSIVGPRPEDPRIVADHYTDWMHETLDVRPGITSPGAVFGYTEGDAYLDPQDPEGSYISTLLPKKLRIERDYLDRAGFFRDLGVLFSTVVTVLRVTFGRK